MTRSGHWTRAPEDVNPKDVALGIFIGAWTALMLHWIGVM